MCIFVLHLKISRIAWKIANEILSKAFKFLDKKCIFNVFKKNDDPVQILMYMNF